MRHQLAESKTTWQHTRLNEGCHRVTDRLLSTGDPKNDKLQLLTILLAVGA